MTSRIQFCMHKSCDRTSSGWRKSIDRMALIPEMNRSNMRPDSDLLFMSEGRLNFGRTVSNKKTMVSFTIRNSAVSLSHNASFFRWLQPTDLYRGRGQCSNLFQQLVIFISRKMNARIPNLLHTKIVPNKHCVRIYF